ncbi:hypothetical protein ONV78_23045 [Hahella sp. CR1]|uniref:hypothetical protein n=1 Tax=Hahella sp. CR1 TaxID=2992807 RepID=UPI0024418A5C|nr:hypothetical protein [Hahella sp. CR1]MDG9670634.1 hypothetical protein [Hahella sp. CR1]
MLLSINVDSKHIDRKRAERLHSFNLNERDLQGILFNSLSRLLSDDELTLIMQSRHWQEEPDMMAIDGEGNLVIFELKAWEAQSINLLQVLRYGQIFGNLKYSDLDSLYKKFRATKLSLKDSHKASFGIEIDETCFNKKQTFVVITNGLDRKTREAIQYWRACGLDVRPWIYRVYRGEEREMLLEMTAFRVSDNPNEDLSEGYYILNTNINNDKIDHDDMLTQGKVAAYFDPWKFKIEKFEKGDVVFLYQSGAGIVALGEADGNLQIAAYQNKVEYEGEEYFMMLNRFQRVFPPLSASEIKEITGTNHRFMGTMFGLDAESGKLIRSYLNNNARLKEA